MKKAISLLLAIAVLLGMMYPSTAFAADRQTITIGKLKTAYSVDSGETIKNTITIKPEDSVKIQLQCYNREKRKWVTKRTFTAKNGKSTIEYPNLKKQPIVSYWRLYCPKTARTKAYTSPKITIAQKKKKQLGLSCKSAVIIESNRKQILYSKNKNKQLAMASTTKLMTALLTLENCKMNEKVVIGAEAPDTPFGILDLKKGDSYTVNQLLTALLIPSANDSSVALAEHISGNTDNFVRLMNERATKLKLKNTHYTSPYGLDNPKHYSSAYDICILHSSLLGYKDFLKIEEKNRCTITNIGKTKVKSFDTTNMLKSSYNNLISGKTGTTTNAGYCFTGAYKYKGTVYVFAILGAPSDNDRWKDCKKILSYIRENG